jgi:predicted Rossmann-fold nucleotide-binding protein
MIAIGGSYGTLSEIALALKAGRTVIGLETWSATDHAARKLGLLPAKNASEAVAMALAGTNDA